MWPDRDFDRAVNRTLAGVGCIVAVFYAVIIAFAITGIVLLWKNFG